MHLRLRSVFGSLLAVLAAGCGPAPSPTATAAAGPVLLYVEYSGDGSSRIVAQIQDAFPFPLQVPENCTVYRIHPSPASPWVAIEFQCANTPQVEFVQADFSGGGSTSWTEENCRFLAWSPDGQAAYLKTDPFEDPEIVVDDLGAETRTPIAVPASVYDLAALPDGRILFSITQGLSFGSQTWLAEADGTGAILIRDLPTGIIAYLRPSPDGRQVAFITFPDSQVPFPDGELWLMDVDGGNSRRLAAADAGHGYPPAWSPDGREIAFVMRDNPSDPLVSQEASALQSNLYRYSVADGTLLPETNLRDAIVESGAWRPDGSALAFNLVRDGTIQVWLSESGSLQPLEQSNTCCAVWVPGR